MNSISFDPSLLLERKYFETFEKTYNFLNPKEKDDLSQVIAELETSLESLVVHLGNDWIGRGELFSTKMDAKIAATEVLLVELRQRIASSN